MSATRLSVDPALAPRLTDARLQVHHAAQLATAIGISYLPHQADDSHTNLGWVERVGALASREVAADTPFRLALRVADLTLVLLLRNDAAAASLSLDRTTTSAAADWIRQRVSAFGADAARFTLDKHYTIPVHRVGAGSAFDLGDSVAFEQLSRWFGGANEVLNAIKEAHHGQAVRCWPHHFDIATLLEATDGGTIGVGLEPGDVYYDEPYYYVNKHPQPSAPPAVALSGNGTWHTRDWIGAVLRGSRVTDGDQRTQIQRFINSAIASYE